MTAPAIPAALPVCQLGPRRLPPLLGRLAVLDSILRHLTKVNRLYGSLGLGFPRTAESTFIAY